LSATDYRSLYADYWSRPDRWGSHSFRDGAELASQVLNVCGPGSVLDAGCGMGFLVRELLSRGVEATGCDVARACVEADNAGAPGRFFEGSLLALPFGDGAFDSVISTDVLEHLAEDDVDHAIGELARVARRNLYIRLSTEPDRDGAWHLTIKPREWWEARFLAAGLRRHPRSWRVLPYEAIDRQGWQVTLMFEKPPERLGRERHGADSASRPDRGSEARLARYAYAAACVRPGDTALLIGCAGGSGAAVVARNSLAARVIATAADRDEIAYAGAAHDLSDTEFRCAQPLDLSFLADRSVDIVVCADGPLAGATEPAALVEFARVLSPGGRLVMAVPDEPSRGDAGESSSPAWRRVASALSEHFLIERCAAQSDARDETVADSPDMPARRLDHVRFRDEGTASASLLTWELDGAPTAHWWLAVAMKSPLGAGKDGYRETAFESGPTDGAYHLTSFARDYDNPWLVRSMVSIGVRATRPALLRLLALETLKGRSGSADTGAALCVLAYQEVERAGAGGGDHTASDDLVGRIDRYQTEADGTAHAWRWKVSCLYAAGLLRLRVGERGEARAAFEACAALDCTRFSPLLASKTVDAAFRAGAMAAADGDLAAARRLWESGVREARRVLTGSWLNILGDEARPAVFGLPEVAVVADAASRCAYGIDALNRAPSDRARVWGAAQTQTFADLRTWAQTLARGKGWLEGELGRARTDASTAVEALRAQIEALENARAWHGEQAASWKGAADRQGAALAETRAWNDRLTEGQAWLQDRIASLEQRLKDAYAESDRRNAWIAELSAGREWFETQRATLTDSLKDRDRQLESLRAWTAELEKGREWLQDQRAGLLKTLTERDRRIAELIDRGNHLHEANGLIESQRAALHAAVLDREHALAELRERYESARRDGAELTSRLTASDARVAALEARVDELDRCLTTRVRTVRPDDTDGRPVAGAPVVVEPKPTDAPSVSTEGVERLEAAPGPEPTASDTRRNDLNGTAGGGIPSHAAAEH